MHLETLRHVVTVCTATGGNAGLAHEMKRLCEQARAELAHEAGSAPARACAQSAAAGWAAV